MTSEGYVYCQGAASLLSVCVKQQISPLDTLTFAFTFTLNININIYINISINIYIRFTLGLGLVIVWLTIGYWLVNRWHTKRTIHIEPSLLSSIFVKVFVCLVLFSAVCHE